VCNYAYTATQVFTELCLVMHKDNLDLGGILCIGYHRLFIYKLKAAHYRHVLTDG
jgi:hypothetical protein